MPGYDRDTTGDALVHQDRLPSSVVVGDAASDAADRASNPLASEQSSDRPRCGYTTLSTPIGELLISGHENGVTGVYFEGRWAGDIPHLAWRDSDRVLMLAWARRELAAYFDGSLKEFTVPLYPNGSAFQLRVWTALRGVRFGEVATYRDIAQTLGNGKAVRAVGAANARNPIPIIIPCHRIIGSTGALTGFGGGLHRKQWLLEHEGARSRAFSV